MSAEEVETGLIEDLKHLGTFGSSDEELRKCSTLLLLPPITRVAEKDVPPTTAARVLLEIVANRAASRGQTRVGIVAEVAGIIPRDERRGVKGVAGAKLRQQKIADREGIGKRAVSDRANKGRSAYVDEILAYARELGRDPSAMDQFMRECGVVDDTASLNEAHRSVNVVPDSQHIRSVPLTKALRQFLDAAYRLCEATDVKLFTPHILWALLRMPTGNVARSCDSVQPGLTSWMHERLHIYLATADRGQLGSFEPFEWEERSDIALAQQIAAQDQLRAANELHVLFALLQTPSTTSKELAERLGPKYDDLVRKAREMGRTEARSTPGPVWDVTTSG